MVARARNRRGEGERLRGVLLDAATDLLAETQDVDQLSVRTITARAGVTPTAFYLHFADKDQLIEEVKHQSFRAFGAVLQRATEQGDDAVAQLRAMGRAYLRFAREQPGQYAICFRTHGYHTRRRPDQKADGEVNPPGIAEAVFRLLVATVDACLGGRADAFETSYALWSAMHGRVTLIEAMPAIPFPDDDRFLDLLINTMITPVVADK